MKPVTLCALVLLICGVVYGYRQRSPDHPHHDRGRLRDHRGRMRDHHKFHLLGRNPSDQLRRSGNDVNTGFRRGHGHRNRDGGDTCPLFCTFDYRPVCGSDGNTYSNKCSLKAEACRKGKRMYVRKEGPC